MRVLKVGFSDWNANNDWSSCSEHLRIIGLFFERLFVRGKTNAFESDNRLRLPEFLLNTNIISCTAFLYTNIISYTPPMLFFCMFDFKISWKKQKCKKGQNAKKGQKCMFNSKNHAKKDGKRHRGCRLYDTTFLFDQSCKLESTPDVRFFGLKSYG